MIDTSKIVFKETSIMMPYIGQSYRYCMEPYVNTLGERELMMAWYSDTRMLHHYCDFDRAMLATYANIYKDDIDWFYAYGLDASCLETWVRLRDLLVCATFFALFPVSDDDTPKASDVVRDTAFLLEVLTRLADGKDVSGFSSQPAKTQYADSIHIYYDIVMGRTAAWLKYLIWCGYAVGLYHGLDYMEAVSSLGERRMGMFVQRIMADCNLDMSKATARFAEAIVKLASKFDTHQMERCPFQFCPVPDITIAAKNVVFQHYYGSGFQALVDYESTHSYAWCGAFEVDPTRCVCTLNSEFEGVAAKTYYSVHLANISASLQEIDISGLV